MNIEAEKCKESINKQFFRALNQGKYDIYEDTDFQSKLSHLNHIPIETRCEEEELRIYKFLSEESIHQVKFQDYLEDYNRDCFKSSKIQKIELKPCFSLTGPTANSSDLGCL